MNDEDAKPVPNYHADRASARTLEERQAHYEFWLAKKAENDTELWTDSEDEHRALWMQRYTRPEAPDIPPIQSLSSYHYRDWTAA